MTKEEVDSLDSLDELLDWLNSSEFNSSVIEPDGMAHGWVTTTRNHNADSSESLWYGLRQEREHFRFAPPYAPFFSFYDGDQQMYSFQSLEEAKAFLRGILWSLSNGRKGKR